MKILIFGMGTVADTYLHTYEDVSMSVVGFLESGESTCKGGGYRSGYQGKPVYSLSDLEVIDYDEIHIANSHYETVQQLWACGVEKSRIVFCYIGLLERYVEENGVLDIKFKLPAVLTSKFFHSGIFGDKIFSICENSMIVNNDYCRLGTLQLIIKEILERDIPGDTAELGVYKGDFAKYINFSFPDRKLYLFDTFEGFSKTEENENIEKGFSSRKDIAHSFFADTSVQTVIDKMEYPDRVVICKGLFPESIPDEIGAKTHFSLVSLDCDLYAPIYKGLEYFYPRLSEGGYIMLHDYNNDKFSAGIKKAVDEYERSHNIRMPKIPLPDEEGTLVITK